MVVEPVSYFPSGCALADIPPRDNGLSHAITELLVVLLNLLLLLWRKLIPVRLTLQAGKVCMDFIKI